MNRSLVLDVLRERSPQSRADLAKYTGLTKPTVSAIVEALIAERLVTELGPGRASTEGGRPPMLLEFDARSSSIAGVHIGVKRTNIVIVDALGRELARSQMATSDSGPDAMLDTVVEELRRGVDAADSGAGPLSAIGVCVPGLVDQHRGSLLLAPNLGWTDVPVRSVLSDRLAVDVFVHNTPQACAVAETVDGAAKGANDVTLLYAGTGVGAGVLTAGRLFRGGAGIAGEVGHCRVTTDNLVCSCGKTGCLETVASVPAIVNRAGVSSSSGRSASFEAVIAAAHDGHSGAGEALERAGHSLGEAAAWLINLFNPEVLVLGGAVAAAGEFVLAPMRRSLGDNALAQSLERVSLRPWALDQDAKVRGAVLVGMQNAESSARVIFSGAQ